MSVFPAKIFSPIAARPDTTVTSLSGKCLLLKLAGNYTRRARSCLSGPRLALYCETSIITLIAALHLKPQPCFVFVSGCRLRRLPSTVCSCVSPSPSSTKCGAKCRCRVTDPGWLTPKYAPSPPFTPSAPAPHLPCYHVLSSARAHYSENIAPRFLER